MDASKGGGYELNEAVIVIKAQQGDPEAFEQLYYLYSQSSIRTAFLMTKNLHTSEDIVQETFVKCYQKLKELKKPEMFKYWFYKMLIRNCWRYAKKEKEQVLVENIPEKGAGIALDDIVGTIEMTKEIYRALSMLSQEHRAVIVLYYYNNMSIKEIAKTLGCFEGTVKSRLYHGRNQLKKEIEKVYGSEKKFLGKECIL